MHTVPPVGYFVVAFVDRSQSKYGSKKWSFRTALSQEDILCYHLGDNHDRMHEVQELVATTPGVQYRVFAENPLHLGHFLESLSDGMFLYVS